MLVSDAARGRLMLVTPILHATGRLSFAALVATAFAVGVFAAPYMASARIVVPEVAGEDERAVLPALFALGGLAFAAVLLRQGAAADVVAVAEVAHG
jgi:hypothetical protein